MKVCRDDVGVREKGVIGDKGSSIRCDFWMRSLFVFWGGELREGKKGPPRGAPPVLREQAQ